MKNINKNLGNKELYYYGLVHETFRHIKLIVLPPVIYFFIWKKLSVEHFLNSYMFLFSIVAILSVYTSCTERRQGASMEEILYKINSNYFCVIFLSILAGIILTIL